MDRTQEGIIEDNLAAMCLFTTCTFAKPQCFRRKVLSWTSRSLMAQSAERRCRVDDSSETRALVPCRSPMGAKPTLNSTPAQAGIASTHLGSRHATRHKSWSLPNLHASPCLSACNCGSLHSVYHQIWRYIEDDEIVRLNHSGYSASASTRTIMSWLWRVMP